MSENTEAKFILNFETFVAETAELGAGYLPPNPIAELSAMQATQAEILVRKQTLDAKEAFEEDKRNTREDLYKTLSTRCSAVINYCKALGVDENDLDNLKYFLREIRGVRAKKIEPVGEGETPPNTISASQKSYASQADFFAQFVEKVRTISAYNATENGLKLTDLEALL